MKFASSAGVAKRRIGTNSSATPVQMPFAIATRVLRKLFGGLDPVGRQNESRINRVHSDIISDQLTRMIRIPTCGPSSDVRKDDELIDCPEVCTQGMGKRQRHAMQ